ncbi:HTH_48 domain-containing protein [Trichonephila clavipes]|nr:HTH_48 domain-containing protein [Trichonephila clavipes]
MKCVYEWFTHFRKGRKNVSNKTRGVRPTTSISDENIEKVKKLITKDRRLTVRMIADELQINHESFPVKKRVKQIEHPPYSSDLNLPDFFLFHRLNHVLKEKRFDDIPDIQRNVTRLLNSIPKEDFLQSFQDMYSSGT